MAPATAAWHRCARRRRLCRGRWRDTAPRRGLACCRGPAIAARIAEHNTIPFCPPWLVAIRAGSNGSAIFAPAALTVTVAGSVRGGAYAEAALRWCERQARAHRRRAAQRASLQDGVRVFHRHGRLAAGYTDDAIAAALERASEANGYVREHGTAAARKTIASGLRAGTGRPIRSA